MEDENGRQTSEAPSATSSDFYNASTLDTQTPTTATVTAAPSASPFPRQVQSTVEMNDQHDDADDEDSSSEMDVSASSRASSPELHTQLAQHAGSKRKLSDVVDVPNGPVPGTTDDMAKKRKLSATPVQGINGNAYTKSPVHLPAELWQQVFLHLPPAMLCRCLRVCRTFHDYLAKIKAPSGAKKAQPKIRILDSEAIWTHARKTFFSNLPKPLPRCSEREMLQLVGGRTCQFCDREPIPSQATTPFNCGPGPDGLRVIWPFAIRACGRCIENNTLKDVQILLSNASALRFGLPYIFLTPDLHFVPEIQRQQPGGIPSHLRVSKVYYTKDIERIVLELEEAKALGDGAADEWRKGLRDKGQEEMTEAARWERWEASMQLGRDLPQALREYDLSSFPNYVAQRQSRSAGGYVNGTLPLPNLPPPPNLMANGPHAMPQPTQPLPHGYVSQYPDSTVPFQQPFRPVRDLHEVELVRQARKLDIERRCKELEPPLEPNVLQHMESFQAAIMIGSPLTEAAWEMLKPRILAQREAAELVEHQRQEQWAALQASVYQPADMEFAKPARELYDKEYEHAQDPLRKKLSEYADECINGPWNGAHHLDRDNAPGFAVDVLLHVRQRYLQDKDAGAIPSVDPPVRPGSKQGTPIPEPFLSLDNMKWVYDNKIRPLTDNYRRELFVCAGCEERKPKWFAFEGLIQHCGAKHTTAFSKGNIIVLWHTSEWPDEAPFHLNPSQFIKPDKRASDPKGHSRVRTTPRANQEAPFAPPGPSRLLSEGPFFSSHGQPSLQSATTYNHASSAYGPYQHGGQGSPRVATLGPLHPGSGTLEPFIDMSEHAQVNKLSNDAREIWDALDGVKELPECVRVQAAVHHVVARFADRFHVKPSLDLVTDALATNAQIRPIKNANGMACQICVASQTDGSASYQSYYARIRNVKLYNASSLITHFKIVHQPREGATYPDWTKHMIELPEQQIISDLINAPGMDDDKLAIIAAAFPSAFPSRLPKIGLVQEAAHDVAPETGLASRLLDRLNKKPKQQPKRKGQYVPNGTGTPGREGSHEPLPEPNEDEYDPRRPMYLGAEERTADPARFDTDIARKAPVAAASPLKSHTLNLAPETLAALNNLSALTVQSKPAVQSQPTWRGSDRGERSPSVGRADNMDSADRANENMPSVQPDISAILASLVPQLNARTQTSTPPKTVSNRSDSAPKYLAADPYGQPYGDPTQNFQDEHRPATRHTTQTNYRSSAELSPRYESQDAHATTARNVQGFQQNQTRTYVEASYPPAHSPPRYRVFDEGGQHYLQQPIYREQPIQYIQLAPDSDRPPVAASPYQYDQPRAVVPPPKPVYVDEYGRRLELIPIDSAPAPVQYVPHPYEQQQQQQRQLQQQPPPPPPQQHYHQQAYAPQNSPPASAAQAVYYNYAASHPPPHPPARPPGMY